MHHLLHETGQPNKASTAQLRFAGDGLEPQVPAVTRPSAAFAGLWHAAVVNPARGLLAAAASRLAGGSVAQAGCQPPSWSVTLLCGVTGLLASPLEQVFRKRAAKKIRDANGKAVYRLQDFGVHVSDLVGGSGECAVCSQHTAGVALDSSSSASACRHLRRLSCVSAGCRCVVCPVAVQAEAIIPVAALPCTARNSNAAAC